MKHVYLAATGQNRGKTTVSLGVLDGFHRRHLSTGFLKPVGQRTIIEDGVPADEDAVLMKQVFGLREPLGQMSPVHIPRGFTQAYIEGAVVEDLPARIRAAHAAFANRDILLIEGTGHAGVGAVIGLSNATVAAMLGAPAVIVSEGGVGRPIDEIVLNASLFERHGVKVAGAIVNKVDLDAKPGLARTLERGLARHGIPLLGVLPYRPILSNPTLAMVLEGVHGETIHPGPDLDEVIGGIAIGAMEPEHMLQRIGPRSLVIVPGDRVDVIGAIVGARADGSDGGDGALGLVLTGGYRPDQGVLAAIRAADLFATLVPEDTYQVASELHDLLVKTHPADAGKIAEIKALLWEYLFIDRVLEVAQEARLDWRCTPSRAAQVVAGPSPSGSLSMRRVVPNRTASDSSAGPSTRSSSVEGRRRPPPRRTRGRPAARRRASARMTSRSASADRSPASQRSRAATSARWRTGAAARSAGERWTFRDERARPSGSRTVGQAIDLGGDGEVAGHLADDHDLLGVLLAEVGVLRPDQVEQDRDDRRHAIEMARSRRAFERTRDRADRDDGVEARRIDLRPVRGRTRGRPPRPRRSRGRAPRRAGTW